jgi:hypothetical protein
MTLSTVTYISKVFHITIGSLKALITAASPYIRTASSELPCSHTEGTAVREIVLLYILFWTYADLDAKAILVGRERKRMP